VSQARDHAWLNGRIVEREAAAPSVASNNLHLGTAVFDGIFAYWNGDHHYAHLAAAHMARLRTGAGRMRLPVPFTTEELTAGMWELIARLPMENHYIRPIVLRRDPELYDIRDSTRPADVVIVAVSAERDVDGSMRCCVSPWRRVSSQAIPVAWKVSGAYANCMLSQHDAYERGYDTAIFLDGRGRISEASTANLFFIAGGALVTPALDADVFPGLTRSLIIERCRERGVRVDVRDVFPAELPSFDGAFICATLLEVRAVSAIDEQRYDTAAHPLFQAVLRDFRELTHERVPVPEVQPAPAPLQ
jgi:branched-chain amino acid aminotransferase